MLYTNESIEDDLANEALENMSWAVSLASCVTKALTPPANHNLTTAYTYARDILMFPATPRPVLAFANCVMAFLSDFPYPANKEPIHYLRDAGDQLDRALVQGDKDIRGRKLKKADLWPLTLLVDEAYEEHDRFWKMGTRIYAGFLEGGWVAEGRRFQVILKVVESFRDLGRACYGLED